MTEEELLNIISSNSQSHTPWDTIEFFNTTAHQWQTFSGIHDFPKIHTHLTRLKPHFPILPDHLYQNNHTAHVYKVLHLANTNAPIHANYPITVVYQSLTDNHIWAREYDGFIQNYHLLTDKTILNKISHSLLT